MDYLVLSLGGTGVGFPHVDKVLDNRCDAHAGCYSQQTSGVLYSETCYSGR